MRKRSHVISFIIIYAIVHLFFGWSIKQWLISIGIFKGEFVFWLLLYLIAYGIQIGRMKSRFKLVIAASNYWLFFVQYGVFMSLLSLLIVMLTPFNRVDLLGYLSFIVLLVLLGVGHIQAYRPVKRHLSIKINKQGKPLRLVIGSDFHLGVLSHKRHLQKFVDMSNAEAPDLVILAGDIVDDHPKWYVKEGMPQVMRQLRSNYGVYGVLGNHEYYGGSIGYLVEVMRNSNVTMLIDETVLIDNRIYLTGQEDSLNRFRKPLVDIKPEDHSLPWIVINHTPNDLQTPANEGVDLHISGHTHKGQMWPNSLVTRRMYELDHGYKQKQNMHVIVSSGFGFWGPPIRLGSRSELWVVDIEFLR